MDRVDRNTLRCWLEREVAWELIWRGVRDDRLAERLAERTLPHVERDVERGYPAAWSIRIWAGAAVRAWDEEEEP